jgi:hypothetical protein
MRDRLANEICAEDGARLPASRNHPVDLSSQYDL